jgi:putative acetyltransferase
VHIDLDDPWRDDVRALLDEHLADMAATSPPESVHALDHGALAAPEVTFWTAREEGVLLGCGALKDLGPLGAEIKSMRTTVPARGRGVATALLVHLLSEAAQLGHRRVSLETGSHEYFAAAHRLYTRHGFTPCGPFGDYELDPNSMYLTRKL